MAPEQGPDENTKSEKTKPIASEDSSSSANNSEGNLEETGITITSMSNAEVMDTIHRWSLKFSGDHDLLDFLERYEELAECHSIPLDRLLPSLLTTLEGNALKWYRVKRGEIKTWVDFRTEAEKFFLSKRHLSIIEHTFYNRRQQNKEKAKDYIITMLTISRRHPQLKSMNHLDRIYDGLRPEYRHYVRRHDFTTLDELMNLTDDFELIKRDEARLERPHTAHMLQVTDIPYSRHTHCWRCKNPGHTRWQCRQTSIRFCSRCGKDDVLSRDCRCTDNVRETSDTTTHRRVSGYFIPVSIDGIDVQALIDTGASTSCIGEDMRTRLQSKGVSPSTMKRRVQMADKRVRECESDLRLSVEYKGKITQLSVTVVPTLAEPLILGMDFLAEQNCRLSIDGETVLQTIPESHTDYIYAITTHTHNKTPVSVSNVEQKVLQNNSEPHTACTYPITTHAQHETPEPFKTPEQTRTNRRNHNHATTSLTLKVYTTATDEKSKESSDDLTKKDEKENENKIQNLTESAREGRLLKFPRGGPGHAYTLRRRQPIQIRSRADHFPLRPQIRRVHNGVLPGNQQPPQLRFGYDSLKSSKYINSKGALPYGGGLKGTSSLKQQLLGIHPNGLHVPALSQQYVQNFKASPAYNGQVVIHPPPAPAVAAASQQTGNKSQKQQPQQLQSQDNSYPKYIKPPQSKPPQQPQQQPAKQQQQQQSLKSTQHDPAMPYPDFKQYPIPDEQQMQKYNEQHDKYLHQQKFLTPRDPMAYYQQQYQQQQQQPQYLYQQQQQQHPQQQPLAYSVQQPVYSANQKPVQHPTALSPHHQPSSIPIHELSDVVASSKSQTGHSAAATISATNQHQQQTTSYGHGQNNGPVKMYSVYEENDMTELNNNDYQTAQYDSSLEKEAQEYLRFMNTNEYFLPKRDPNYKLIDEENDRRQQYNFPQQQQQQQPSVVANYGNSQVSSSPGLYQQQQQQQQQNYKPYYQQPEQQQPQQIYYGHHPDSSVAASSSFKEPIQVSKLFYQDETTANGGPSTVVRTSYQTAYNANHFAAGHDSKAPKYLPAQQQTSTPSAPVSVNNVYSQVRQSAQSSRTPEPLRFEFTERDAMVGGVAYTHAPKPQYKYKVVDYPVTPRPTAATANGNSQVTTTSLPSNNIRSSTYSDSIKPIVEEEDDPEDGDDMQHAGTNLYGRQPLQNKNSATHTKSSGSSSTNNNKSSTTTEAPPSEQKDTEDYCERICAIVEDENEEIVCGSDGYMYTSEAQMECYASCLHIDVTIQGKGSCSAR
ncbi:uncharacterized protein [Musca autumnalis]|uniref:uncharacterized protein n=1 Tax=Musca autumnalis TaxID=221902 RepID=UPI003CF0702B